MIWKAQNLISRYHHEHWFLLLLLLILQLLAEIGTHKSFIKLPTGKFLVINTVDITPAAKSAIDSLTNNGQLIEAVLATHPFHTIYFPSFHRLYPNTRYYGCPRHLKKVSIPWTGSLVDPAILSSWEDQGVFLRVPDGTDILTPAEDNHLSCVFVFLPLPLSQ
eukprot:gene5627-6202_t